MKTVLITGATCYIGQILIQYILGNYGSEYKIVAVVRPGTAHRLPSLREGVDVILELSMDEYNEIPLSICQADIVISLAWNGTRGAERNNPLQQQANYKNSIKLLHSAACVGCQQFVTAGSQAEYGNLTGLIHENSPCMPNTQYGKWKLRFFEDCLTFGQNEGIKIYEPRFFSLYSENDNPCTMLIDVVQKMLNNLPCDLTLCVQQWNYLYMDDAVDALFKLIMKDPGEGVYNFGSDDQRILKDYIEEIRTVIGSTSELRFGAVAYPPTGMVSIMPDISKLKSAVDWSPQTTFATGIKRIINKYSNR